jgi:hypothetical protein
MKVRSKLFKVVKAIHSITYLNEAVSTWIQDLPKPSSSKQYTATVILKNTHQLGQIQHHTHTRTHMSSVRRKISHQVVQTVSSRNLPISHYINIKVFQQFAYKSNSRTTKVRRELVACNLPYKRGSHNRPPLFTLDTWQYDNKTDHSAAICSCSSPHQQHAKQTQSS